MADRDVRIHHLFIFKNNSGSNKDRKCFRGRQPNQIIAISRLCSCYFSTILLCSLKSFVHPERLPMGTNVCPSTPHYQQRSFAIFQ